MEFSFCVFCNYDSPCGYLWMTGWRVEGEGEWTGDTPFIKIRLHHVYHPEDA